MADKLDIKKISPDGAMGDTVVRKYKDMGDGTYALVVFGDGGGGGGTLSDVLLRDSTGQIFVYRDSGTSTPTAYAIPGWTSYTPVAPITAVVAGDIPYTGNATATTPLVIDVRNTATLGFDASGTWSGSIIVESSMDGVNYRPTTFAAETSGGVSTAFSAPTSGTINTVSTYYIRFRSNTIASGSATIRGFLSGKVSNVMLDNPLPAGSNTIGGVTITQGAASSTAVIGSTSASTTVGPFVPQLGRDMLVELSGTWTGSVQLMRSTDGGTTQVATTINGGTWGLWTANASESPVTPSSTRETFYLAVTIASGILAYKIFQ
jgi:hypothetical protein